MQSRMATAAKSWVPFDERSPETHVERRARQHAMPIGSRCACADCAAGWALSHGAPESLEAELRART
jgi:hypothetical protein